jgi:hypothetical protein
VYKLVRFCKYLFDMLAKAYLCPFSHWIGVLKHSILQRRIAQVGGGRCGGVKLGKVSAARKRM